MTRGADERRKVAKDGRQRTNWGQRLSAQARLARVLSPLAGLCSGCDTRACCGTAECVIAGQLLRMGQALCQLACARLAGPAAGLPALHKEHGAGHPACS